MVSATRRATEISRESRSTGLRRSPHSPLLIAVTYTALGVLPLYLMSAYSVRIRAELGFGTALYGVAVSIYFAASSAAAPFLGRLVERIDTRTAMRCAASCVCVAILGIASVAHTWLVLVAFLVVGGVANSFSQVIANLLLATGVERHQGIAFGVKQAAVPIAGLVAGTVLPPMSGALGWRDAMALLAIVPAVGVIAVPRVGAARGSGGGFVRSTASLPRSVYVLALAALFAGATGNSLSVFIVDAGVAQGMSEAAAGGLLAGGSALAIMMRVSAGWYVDRIEGDGAVQLASLMLGGSAAFGFLAFAGGSSTFFVIAALAAFGAGWGWPGLLYYHVVRRFPAWPGAATGLIMSGGFLGTLLGPVTIGTLATHLSYAWGWGLACFALAVASVTIFLSRSVEPTQEPVGDVTLRSFAGE
jgi:MFS family permease